MTGKDIIDQVMDNIGKVQTKLTDTNLRAIILNWANRVREDISARSPHWIWLEDTDTITTVADQAEYDLPSEYDVSKRSVVSLYQYETPAKLKYINARTLDLIEPKISNRSGNPTAYSVFADKLILYPVPDDAYTVYLRFIKTVSALLDSTADKVDIPDKYKKVVIDGVLINAYQMFPEWGNAATQVQIYEAGIIRMLQENREVVDDENISYAHTETGLSAQPPYHFDITDVG